MTQLMDVLVNLSPVAAILLKVSVLLTIGWALHAALRIRKANPEWRQTLWRGVMAGLLLVPVAHWLGRWDVHVNPPAILRPEAAIVMPTEIPATALRLEPPAASMPTTRVAPPPVTDEPVSQATGSHFSVSAWVSERMAQILLTGWLIGAIVLFVRYWALIVRVRRILAGSRPASPNSQSLLDGVARDMGSKKPVQLRLTPGIESPFLTGLRRPAIVLPDRMEKGMDAADLPGILAHEVAHIRAHDLWWMGLARFISTLLWFHPLVWRLRAVHCTACEESCDAVAAQYVGNAETYATTLARVALAIVSNVPSIGGIPMARSSQIMQRLRLLGAGVRSSPIRRGRLVLCAAVGIAVLAGVVGVRLVYAQPVPGPSATVAGESASPAHNEAPATARLQATVYEVHVAPESIAALDAARLARQADFSKALDDVGKKRILYAVDQKVSLAGDRLITGSHEPMVTSRRMTDTGQTVNTVQYQELGVVIKIKGAAAPSGKLAIESDIEASIKTDSQAKISEGVATPSVRKFSMSLKGPVDIGKPVVIFAADAASLDADGKAVLCVCRMVMGAEER